jgi:hypothetical protein
MIFPKAEKPLGTGIRILSIWLLIQAIVITPPRGLAEDEPVIEESPPSNEELVRGGLRSLFGKAFGDFPEADSKLVYLKAEQENPAAWLVEDELVSFLLSRNYQVGRSPALSPAAGAADSAHVLPESRSLYYRIIDLRLDYPKVIRKRFLGARWVTRRATLSLAFELKDEPSGKVLWVKREKEETFDLIKKSLATSLGNESYAFLSPSLPGDAQDRYLEPALVATAVGGLIYLFFANR